MASKIVSLTVEQLKRVAAVAALRHFGQAPIAVDVDPGGRAGGPAFHLQFGKSLPSHRSDIDCAHHEPCPNLAHPACALAYVRIVEPELVGPDAAFETVTSIQDREGGLAGASILLPPGTDQYSPLEVWSVEGIYQDDSEQAMTLTVLAKRGSTEGEVRSALERRLRTLDELADLRREGDDVPDDIDTTDAYARLTVLQDGDVAIYKPTGTVYRPWESDPVQKVYAHGVDYDLTAPDPVLPEDEDEDEDTN